MKRHTIASLTAQMKSQGQMLLDIRRELDARGNLERANARDTVIRETERESDLRESPATAIRPESVFGDRVRSVMPADVLEAVVENREILQKNIAALGEELRRDVAPEPDYEIVHEGLYYVDVEGVRVVSESPMRIESRR